MIVYKMNSQKKKRRVSILFLKSFATITYKKLTKFYINSYYFHLQAIKLKNISLNALCIVKSRKLTSLTSI